MPKFLGDMIKDRADNVLGGLRNNNVPADVQSFAQQQFGGAVANFKRDFQADFVNSVLGNRKAQGSGEESDGAGGWLQAIAKAMGQALGDKAKHLVELSSKMTDLQQAKSTATDPKVKQEEDGKNAQEFNKTMTEFQATGQGIQHVEQRVLDSDQVAGRSAVLDGPQAVSGIAVPGARPASDRRPAGVVRRREMRLPPLWCLWRQAAPQWKAGRKEP